MSEDNIDNRRRRIMQLGIATAVAVPVAALLDHGKAMAGDLPRLSLDERSAKALSYVHDAGQAPAGKRKDGTYCKNCNLIQSTEGEWRPCSIFPGKVVNANGWCLAWVGRV